jgi:hypothetical protein
MLTKQSIIAPCATWCAGNICKRLSLSNLQKSSDSSDHTRSSNVDVDAGGDMHNTHSMGSIDTNADSASRGASNSAFELQECKM